MITINGRSLNINGVRLIEYLTENSYNIQRVVVELNGNILPKGEYETTVLKENDVVEILAFVGGG